MSSSSRTKRVKRTVSKSTEGDSRSDLEVEVESLNSSGNLSSTQEKSVLPCVICNKPSSSKISKDDLFGEMLQLFWCTCGIDVKPDICKKSDICTKCFEDIVKYYEVNEIMVFMENSMKSVRVELIDKTLKGITKLENDNQNLSKIQQAIKEKSENLRQIAEEKQYVEVLDRYEAAFSMVDDNRDADATGEKKGKKKKITLSKKRIADDKKDSSKISLKRKAEAGQSSHTVEDSNSESN